MKRILNRFFVEGLNGMACGLFVTLILGTLLMQAGTLLEGKPALFLTQAGRLAASLTGAGIGIGIASRLQESPLCALPAAIAGMAGAYAGELSGGTVFAENSSLVLSGYGEPLGAFLAAFAAIELSRLIEGRTKMDLVLAPLAGILGGSLVGLWAGVPISRLMKQIGLLIEWGTKQQPWVMGVVVSVLMCMAITLPLNCAALGVMLNLSGLAGGAATIGCCTCMVGFAVASYEENGVSGLVSLGIGTPVLQLPNILKRPLIWLPVLLTSAVLGPIGTVFAKMSNTAAGAGMGTTALAGPLLTWQTMIPNEKPALVFFKILFLYFLLPGLLSLGITRGMRKLNLIKPQDMELDI